MYFNAKGSLDTTFHITESVNIGDDIASNTLLTVQYNPSSISQISASTIIKFYNRKFQNSLYALVKQHQITLRGILNTTREHNYKYDMDIGFDDDLLTGHTERTNGQQITVSDIDAKKCQPIASHYRCYKGNITVRASNSGTGQKGTFHVMWSRRAVNLDVNVPEQLKIKFDHTHSGRIRDDNFESKTRIEGRSLRSDNRGVFLYSGSATKQNGKWNDLRLVSSLSEMKTGQKSLETEMRLKQKITDKRLGQFHRKIEINLKKKGNDIV